MARACRRFRWQPQQPVELPGGRLLGRRKARVQGWSDADGAVADHRYRPQQLGELCLRQGPAQRADPVCGACGVLRTCELQPGPVRAGSVDGRSSDAQCWPPRRFPQHAGGRPAPPRWSAHWRSRLSQDRERAQLERSVSTHRCRVRFCRHRQDRAQGHARPVCQG